MAETDAQFESVLQPLTPLEKVRAIRVFGNDIVPIAICLEEWCINQLGLAERRRILEREDGPGWHAVMLNMDRLISASRAADAIPALVDLLDFAKLNEIAEQRLAQLSEAGFHVQVMSELRRFCSANNPNHAVGALGALLRQPECCSEAYEILVETMAGAPDNKRAAHLSALIQAVGTDKEASAARLLWRNFDHMSGEQKMLAGRRLQSFVENGGEIAGGEKLLDEVEGRWVQNNYLQNDMVASLSCLDCLVSTALCERAVVLLTSVVESSLKNTDIPIVLRQFSASAAAPQLLQWAERWINETSPGCDSDKDHRGVYLSCLGAFSQTELNERFFILAQGCLSAEHDHIFLSAVSALGRFAGTSLASQALEGLRTAFESDRMVYVNTAIGALRNFVGTPEGEATIPLLVDALAKGTIHRNQSEIRVRNNLRSFAVSDLGPALLEGLWGLLQDEELTGTPSRIQLFDQVLGAYASGPHGPAAATVFVRDLVHHVSRYESKGFTADVSKTAQALLYDLCQLFQVEASPLRDPRTPGGVDVPDWVQQAAKTK